MRKAKKYELRTEFKAFRIKSDKVLNSIDYSGYYPSEVLGFFLQSTDFVSDDSEQEVLEQIIEHGEPYEEFVILKTYQKAIV